MNSKLLRLLLLLLATPGLHAQPGSLDSGFDPGNGPSFGVLAIALQPDGKILIGGAFTSYNGIPCSKIARLNADGSLDTSFYPGSGADSTVLVIAEQPDGKTLIGGDFTSYNDVTRKGIARLNADGSLDTGFNPGIGTNGGKVEAIAVQSDGKILIGGRFSIYNTPIRTRIARLNANGSLDTSFYTGSGINNYGTWGEVYAIAVHPDGKILMGGWFTSFGGVPRNGIARLNADGSLDTGFDPGTGVTTVNVNGHVFAIAVQPDGKIMIGGSFLSYNGISRHKIARLNSNGSLDTGFNPGGGANGSVRAMAMQPDGKILIGGQFSGYNGTFRLGIARLNSDGSLDTGFDSGFGVENTYGSGSVRAIAVQPDGKILIGGLFTSYNGTARNFIARLKVDMSLSGNECADANYMDALFKWPPNAPRTSGLWDNTLHTASASDPEMDCWEENSVNTSIWYRFTGTGIPFRIQTVPCNATNYIGTALENPGNTQIAIYSGNDCNNLTQVACNDDLYANGVPDFRASLDFPTETGQQYFLLIDGFNTSDGITRGQFCIEVTSLAPTSVTEIDKTDIRVFPNPTTGRLQLANIRAEQVNVYDNTGRLMQHISQSVSEVDLSGLPAGVYVLKITEGDSVYSARVVLAR